MGIWQIRRVDDRGDQERYGELDSENEWDAWRDGCEDAEDGGRGEGPNEVAERIDFGY